MKRIMLWAALLWLLPVASPLAMTADNPNIAPDLNADENLPGDFPRFSIPQNGPTASRPSR
jgi:hypothetical protein